MIVPQVIISTEVQKQNITHLMNAQNAQAIISFTIMTWVKPSVAPVVLFYMSKN